MGSKRNEILGLTLIYLIIGLYSNEFTALVQAESESTAKIDSRLLSLIGQYASDYYNPEWDLTLDQYRAWIATIAWGEGGKGGYTAHSQYGKYKEAKLDGDRFDHVVIGDRFRFSTGIGPFQLDRLQETAFWPTIKKLNPKEALLYVLNWHYTNKGKGANLASFSDNSPWLAVRPGRVESCWKEVTGSEWDDHKSGKNEKLAWTDVVNRIRMDEPEYLFENNVRYIGKVRWMVNFITETDKKVSFNRYYDTFSITARTWDGVPLFSYYYAYDRSAGCEVWVLDNSGEENEFRYIFVREYVTGPLPEHRTHEGAYWIGDRYIALAGETTLTEPALDLSDKQCPSISDGLHWLRREQNLDGSWTYSGRITEENVGLTSIAVLSFLNWGLDETDFNVLQAINWILEQQKIDGSITTGTYEVYDTSLAILALVATRKSKYYSNITSATNFLISIQNDEDTGYSQLSKYYGGWPYWKGMSDWADLSNSQFVMLALWYAEQFNPTDTIVPAEVWNKAEIFVTRCQNRKESNPDYSFYNDGGFIYQPSSTIWAGGQSYASMTAAGLWGLFTCGVNKEDGRIRDAWKWLENNYHIDQNYPMGNLFLYYYLYGLAKACLLWGVNSIAGHDWYQEMTEFLINNQQSDGRWVGTNPTEEPDVVATCWALLALESKLIAPGGKLSVKVDSPADLHLYDPLNRHVGINYETGKVELQIPGANYSGPETEPQIIEVLDPTAGDYRIRLVGREEGAFILIIEGMVDNETIYSKAFEGHISIGEEKELSAVISAIAGPITIDIPDTIPPDPIADLIMVNATFNSVTLVWTAPGDDWSSGTASQYDIRYSTQPITEENWDEAIRCEGEPLPQPAGSRETFTITGLERGVTYYFAIKTADEVPNWSKLSNVAKGFTWNYIFEDVERGTKLAINTNEKAFQFASPDKDFGVKEASYMRVCGRAITIWHKDAELRLITLAVDTKLDFCVAVAWDLKTNERYFLIDKIGIED